MLEIIEKEKQVKWIIVLENDGCISQPDHKTYVLKLWGTGHNGLSLHTVNKSHKDIIPRTQIALLASPSLKNVAFNELNVFVVRMCKNENYLYVT